MIKKSLSRRARLSNEGLKLKYFDGDEREENYEVGISPLVVMDSPGVESWWLGRMGAIMM